MQSPGNIINDLQWAVGTLPGLEARRFTGYIDVLDIDVLGKWYPVRSIATGRDDATGKADRPMILPENFKITHFAIEPHVLALRDSVAHLSLRNPGFLQNERYVYTVGTGTPVERLQMRFSRGPSYLVDPPYLAHQLWIRLVNAPAWSGRLAVSVGAIRPTPIFDFYNPAANDTGVGIWGDDGNGGTGNGSFSITPGISNIATGESVTLYSSSPATWVLVGEGTLSATVGTSVVYTASGNPGSALITATSLLESQMGATATALVVVAGLVVSTVTSVTLTATPAAILVGGVSTVVATVVGTNSPNPDVTYTITGPGFLTGAGNAQTVTATGAGTITVTATSVGDPTKSTTVQIVASVPVPVVASVTLASDVLTITTADTANLSALVTVSNGGNPGVTYSITGPGTLSGAGLNRTLVPTGIGSIVVTATSIQDPSQSASVTIPVTAPVSVVASVTLASSRSSMTTDDTANLSALVTVSNGGDAGVVYSITGPGTLSGTGLTRVLTPTAAGSIVVTATSIQDPTKFASVTIAASLPAPVVPVVTVVTLVSDKANMTTSETSDLAALVTVSSGGNAGVIYSITGPGTLAGTGLTRVLAATGAGTIVVTATSIQDPTKSASVTIAATAPTPVVASVTLTSNVPALAPDETANLTALVTVNNGGNPGVAYSITGPGILSGTGLTRMLTPTGTGSIVVTATSIQDPTKSASVTIPVAAGVPSDPMLDPYGNPLGILVQLGRDKSPIAVGEATLARGQVYNSDSNRAMVFTISGPGVLSGAGFNRLVTATGLGTITVTATSVQDPSKSASTTINTTAPYVTAVSLATDRSIALVGELANLTASPSGFGSFDPSVTYSATGPGTLSGTGLTRVLTPTGIGSIVVTATSVQDPTKSASRTVEAVSSDACLNTAGTWEFFFAFPSLAPDPNRITRLILGGSSTNPPVNGSLSGGLVVNVLLNGVSVLASSSPGATAIWKFKPAANIPLGCNLPELFGSSSNWVTTGGTTTGGVTTGGTTTGGVTTGGTTTNGVTTGGTTTGGVTTGGTTTGGVPGGGTTTGGTTTGGTTTGGTTTGGTTTGGTTTGGTTTGGTTTGGTTTGGTTTGGTPVDQNFPQPGGNPPGGNPPGGNPPGGNPPGGDSPEYDGGYWTITTLTTFLPASYIKYRGLNSGFFQAQSDNTEFINFVHRIPRGFNAGADDYLTGARVPISLGPSSSFTATWIP